VPISLCQKKYFKLLHRKAAHLTFVQKTAQKNVGEIDILWLIPTEEEL
jgi:hypothetical protein